MERVNLTGMFLKVLCPLYAHMSITNIFDIGQCGLWSDSS